ncbi:N-acetylglucosamine-6-phosphate deacetylase [Yoonia sediminilitoris]|uniref:N-acetylglucosamine 6-phosphate deacetylase n=1 Tax=Yoonia sediminilitoris TaxID=1286148 RepID=A0A2T6KIR6_9RHOB|nr:N-acetylglucosamine-6-phosphate deacetylase [Yoonia sediminilitoris]PUB15614.1 N-acetylglucosamine 6-phosphate deacetylase [Yoonia sediminilitoris]RCW96223.1 N-acetylglucosamine 6-phosphate deacetylase [Yoonia sediminilitoris]
MTDVVKAIVGAQIHDGESLYDNHALVVTQDGQRSIRPRDAVLPDWPLETRNGGLIAPGFVDLQVNGGGGIMFNDDQSVGALRTIARAHATIGTSALLPTLITDTPERTAAAIDAVEMAIAEKVAGIVGIHLEGPHLSVARKGAHDPGLIRPMTDDDLGLIIRAAERLPNVMVTVAPENTTNTQISKLSDAGVVVSLGHTDADMATCLAAFDAGARCVTHLFNAMSQLQGREPGLVGAAMLRDDIYAGMIADGIHVHPASLRTALAARSNNDRLFLVTDAMATAGSTIKQFQLNGRDVLRKDDRLTLCDGTLAGADLEMAQAVSVMVNAVGDDMASAVRRATTTPAGILRHTDDLGRLTNPSNPVVYMRGGRAAPEFILFDQARSEIAGR